MGTPDPLLQDLADAMGSHLTAEMCAERYARTWEESHLAPLRLRSEIIR